MNEEKSESENERSDSENERLIRSFVRAYEWSAEENNKPCSSYKLFVYLKR